MKIEELALKVADELNEMKHKGKSFAARDAVIDDYAIRFATRFLAAYTEQQEPVIHEGRPYREWYSRKISECGDPNDLPSGARYAAPPLPAIPAHLCVVPREPTKEMVAASWYAAGSVRFGDGQEKYIAVAWQAMIAAGEVKL